MELTFRDGFLTRWHKYFPGAELPITFEYTDEERGEPAPTPTEETRCIIGALRAVRGGVSFRFGANSFGCMGGKYYCGFSPNLRRGIEEFLSHDAKGEGERYKKTPEIASIAIQQNPRLEAPAKYLLFKRWDHLDERDLPVAAIFYATPDVLSGLFTLAGYDEPNNEGAVALPFSSGCGSVIKHALAESRSPHPRAILGLFDVSSRPYVSANVLSFSVPLQKLQTMTENMDESFLVTDSWNEVKRRMKDKG
jgi:hypothetical protein